MKYAVALLGCVSFFSTSASAAQWDGSYSANGQCFCVGAVDASVSSAIVPTPIGGQTVAQVCKRVGAGPGLYKEDGLFNHPAYPGAQCGNGPFPTGLEVSVLTCAGTLDGKSSASSESCQPVGPQWDLKSAFSNKPSIALATPEKAALKVEPKVEVASLAQDTDKAASGGGSVKKSMPTLLNSPVVTTHVVEGGSSDGKTGRPLKATVISSASTAGRKLPKPASFPPFTGKKVLIDGQQYMQARDDLDASGGEPGSRIIIDGLLFLRDDESLLPADLYREPPKAPQAAKQKKAATKTAASAKKIVTESPNTLKAATAPVDLKASQSNASRDKQLSEARESKRASDAEALRLAKLRIEMRAAVRAKEQARLDELARVKEQEASQQIRIAAAKPLDADSAVDSVNDSAVDSANDLDDADVKMLSDDLLTQMPIPPSPLSTPTNEAATTADSEAVEQVAVATKDASSGSSSTSSPVLSALRLPPEVRASSRNFSYIEALPASYDVGGSGIVLEGSAESRSGFQYFGRVGVTSSYQELMVGGGYYLTPASADRFTAVLMAGLEHGSFALTDEQDPSIAVNFTDTGLYFGAATRFVVNNRFELKAGVGYSTFFEGDAMIFGGGYYHITRSLDLVSRFELGDNDLLGLGVRFYY